MISKEEILSFLRTQKSGFLTDYRVAKLGLFGSYATGEASENSDIDLIVEFLPETENLSEKKAGIKSVVSQRFNKNVDICREKYIKPYFKNQILQSAIYV